MKIERIIPLIVIMIAVSVQTMAATITVCDSGCDYTSIQPAVDAASPGDEVSIDSRVYFEHVTIDKAIEIYGVYNTTAILPGGPYDTFTINASGVTVRDLIFPSGIAGVRVERTNSTTIQDCIFMDDPDGIIVFDSTDIAIINNSFIRTGESAVKLDQSERITLRENVVSNSTFGFLLLESHNSTIENNRISGCNISINVRESMYNQIHSNTIIGSEIGINNFHSDSNNYSNNNGSGTNTLFGFISSYNNIIGLNHADGLYAKDVQTGANYYQVKGFEFTGEQIEFAIKEANETPGFKVLSDVVEVNFIEDVSYTSHVDMVGMVKESDVPGIDISTIGFYSFFDNLFRLISPGIFDGENITATATVIDADGMHEVLSDAAVDTNGNGLYEYLEVNLTLQAFYSGDYTISGSLYNGDVFVTDVEAAAHLGKGFNLVTLKFSGPEIWDSRESGNYWLNNLAFHKTDRYFIEQENPIYTTLGYLFNWFEPLVVNYTLSLSQGWNLVSVPLNVTDASALDSLAKFGYNGTWHVPDSINYSKGYWVKSDTGQDIVVYGIELENETLELHEGMSLVGLPGIASINLTERFTNSTTILTYDNGTWTSFVANRTMNPLESMEPGMGYLVNVDENVTLS